MTDLSSLDSLQTEAVADPELHLDSLSDEALVLRMNDRDALIAQAVREASNDIAQAISAAAARMRRGGRLIYVGAGTSGRLGILDASEIPPTFGLSADRVVGVIAGGTDAITSAIEGAEDHADLGASDIASLGVTEVDTVVGIAASGRTPYVIGALDEAGARGALRIGLSCNSHAPVSAAADYAIEIEVGPEVLTGSTRLGSGTATKLVLNMISTICMIRLGKTYKTLMVDMNASNAKLVHRAERMVVQATGASEVDARDALAQSAYNVKLAVAIILTGLSSVEAQNRLDAADGILSKVVRTA